MLSFTTARQSPLLQGPGYERPGAHGNGFQSKQTVCDGLLMEQRGHTCTVVLPLTSNRNPPTVVSSPSGSLVPDFFIFLSVTDCYGQSAKFYLTISAFL